MLQAPRPFVLGIGGTPRAGSSTEHALALSLAAAAEAGADTLLINGPALMLPIYDPGRAERTPEAARLISAFRRCHGLIVASPAYHGTVSGLVKNALDYCEDLRADERIYFDGIAVGLVVCAAGGQAGGQTLATLRGIVHALRGWPTPLAAVLNTASPVFDAEGCQDPTAQAQLRAVGRQVVEFARMRIASRMAAG